MDFVFDRICVARQKREATTATALMASPIAPASWVATHVFEERTEDSRTPVSSRMHTSGAPHKKSPNCPFRSPDVEMPRLLRGGVVMVAAGCSLRC